jgi:hypothetical protein
MLVSRPIWTTAARAQVAGEGLSMLGRSTWGKKQAGHLQTALRCITQSAMQYWHGALLGTSQAGQSHSASPGACLKHKRLGEGKSFPHKSARGAWAGVLCMCRGVTRGNPGSGTLDTVYGQRQSRGYKTHERVMPLGCKSEEATIEEGGIPLTSLWPHTWVPGSARAPQTPAPPHLKTG